MEIYLANPRGFCAGVERAVEIVERAIKKYGAPIYVRHEIVHNKFVVDSLRKKGAIFVEEVDEIPQGAVTIFSAHGVSDKVEEDSEAKDLGVIDATCPLVKKVHNQVKRFDDDDYQIILIGHQGHPEVEGTSGRAKKDVILVEKVEDVAKITVKNPNRLYFVTQTTLSVDDTKDIIAALQKRFPNIDGPAAQDICYATQNRQDAVKQLVEKVDVLFVIGAQNSSNSNRLRDIGEKNNIPSYLIPNPQDISDFDFSDITKIGVTAGASAPEVLVSELIDIISSKFNVVVKTIGDKKENITFNIPKILSDV